MARSPNARHSRACSFTAGGCAPSTREDTKCTAVSARFLRADEGSAVMAHHINNDRMALNSRPRRTTCRLGLRPIALSGQWTPPDIPVRTRPDPTIRASIRHYSRIRGDSEAKSGGRETTAIVTSSSTRRSTNSICRFDYRCGTGADRMALDRHSLRLPDMRLSARTRADVYGRRSAQRADCHAGTAGQLGIRQGLSNIRSTGQASLKPRRRADARR